MSHATPDDGVGTGRNAALWAGVLLPPFAWLLALQVTYSLVTSNCQKARPALLHGVLVGAVVLLGLGAFSAWRSWRALRGRPGTLEDSGVGRARFMAAFGLLSSALFTLLLVATAIPTFLLRPCD
ncbi:hypothetical protein D7X55_30680 [Corallococcus sp. AB049A]|uniref:Uncharacterized protein n=1 Tax=Corallococcus interemptor TaxID=2316720 RepID=A0A3A8QR32_9BACT|nr:MULTISPECIES: hypothetical protein [Corallococcus]RKH43065.1 hypothetical protein D7Y23_30005 [Corallococcus sp. AB050B]RKH65614.1 hypothetical protein D7X96_23320 [Corallococcus interemptor]RKI53934.1 hypothetical protein D7X55_30680 [Corallococcus sp. AB049A]